MQPAKKSSAGYKKARHPGRDRAYQLFATGKKLREIAEIVGTKYQMVSVWKIQDSWDARLADEQRRYREELAKRTVSERAKRDAEAIAGLLSVRSKLITHLDEHFGKMDPDKIAASLKAVQDVMARIEPPKEQDHGHEVVDVDFVPAEVDEADGEGADG